MFALGRNWRKNYFASKSEKDEYLKKKIKTNLKLKKKEEIKLMILQG